MKHGSLFSGIGGFDLAAEWMGWENGAFQYVVQVPVFPFTKNTWLKGKLRGYAVHKLTGELWDAPFLEFQMDAEQYRIYNDVRMWITYLMSQNENMV